MRDLKELLLESGCSSEFILEAMRFEHLFTGDVDAFLDKVEDILMNEEDYEEELEDEDDEDFDEEEDDPIYQSDYNYDGNEDNIYFEDEDGEEAFEDDEDEE
ncbi:hypothetical protein [Sulfurospirillum multivorans]|uniref:Uncharacterized protein n=2 Tax=Sulfurospirillum multivorans TaxID=66821 RepID=A0AA86DZM2_SULMK|nr:hypothetical protein [Sulfurospirillum multivorans]AHJ12615.1 hypothetical protein SMUL_1354 [Sulfurospirillum multivorans DSM 12446]QEH06110.1 hypothetical protein SMN_1339 [Sulfurospirillum multivorans]